MDNYKNGYQPVKTEGDQEILITTIILIVIGLLAVVSASIPYCISKHMPPFFFVLQHIFWIFLGSIGLWCFSKFDYNNLKKFTFSFAFFVIIYDIVIYHTSHLTNMKSSIS